MRLIFLTLNLGKTLRGWEFSGACLMNRHKTQKVILVGALLAASLDVAVAVLTESTDGWTKIYVSPPEKICLEAWEDSTCNPLQDAINGAFERTIIIADPGDYWYSL